MKTVNKRKKRMTTPEAARNFTSLIAKARYKRNSTFVCGNKNPISKITPAEPKYTTGKDILALWNTIPHLTPEEATELESDIKKGRDFLLPVESKWE